MQTAKYLTNDELFDTLGDFSMEMLETMGNQSIPPESRAKWLSARVEILTQAIWDRTPRMGEIYPSNN